MKTWQFYKKRRRLTTFVQASVGGRYSVSLLHEIDYKPGFSEIEEIVSEHLGVLRNTDLAKMRPLQVLSDVALTRSDLEKIVEGGEFYLDKVFEKANGTSK